MAPLALTENQLTPFSVVILVIQHGKISCCFQPACVVRYTPVLLPVFGKDNLGTDPFSLPALDEKPAVEKQAFVARRRRIDR